MEYDAFNEAFNYFATAANLITVPDYIKIHYYSKLQQLTRQVEILLYFIILYFHSTKISKSKGQILAALFFSRYIFFIKQQFFFSAVFGLQMLLN